VSPGEQAVRALGPASTGSMVRRQQGLARVSHKLPEFQIVAYYFVI
jgi:hypothetical protein